MSNGDQGWLEKLLIGAEKAYQHLIQEVIPETHPSDLPDASTGQKAVKPLGGWKGVEGEANNNAGNEG